MNLRPLTAADLPSIAVLHKDAFPRTVASRLGLEASRRQYESLMSGPFATAGMGAFDHDRLVGFCFVGVRHASERDFVRRNFGFLFWRLASRPWLLADAVICRRLGEAVNQLWACRPRLRMRSTAEVGESVSGSRFYGLHYLAVDPLFRGRGVGQNLVAAGESLAREKGFSEIQLSVETNNAPAIGLYLRMGWQKSSPSGEWLGLMSKRLVSQ